MRIGLLGKKCGMTRIFTEDGQSIPVTVLEVQPNRVTQIKSKEKDGYRALQVTAGEQKTSRVNKAQAGHFSAAATPAGRITKEFRLAGAEAEDIKLGDSLTVELFQAGQKVDVRAKSKGKSTQGAVKRWNFRTQDATHGNSLSHRAPGSLGQCQTPGRVFKGKKMAGRMGNEKKTVQNQEIVRVDVERNLILIKGAVPGAPGADVIILHSVKQSGGSAE